MKFPNWLLNEFVNQIHREVFNNNIPFFDELDIQQKTPKQNDIVTDCLAISLGNEIIFNTELIHDTDELFNTMAHELIHFYQWAVGVNVGHNTKFFKYYANKVCTLYGYKTIR